MATEVKMPKLGMTMTKGKIISWLFDEGDSISKGESLFSVANDKVNIDVEAPISGTLLEITIKEGEIADVGEVVAYIGEKNECIDTKNPQQMEEKKVGSSLFRNESGETRKGPMFDKYVKATPVAKAIAKEKNINLSEVKGSGIDGRIKRCDVESYKPEMKLCEDKKGMNVFTEFSPTEISAMGAAKMVESFKTVPHFYLGMKINVKEAQSILANARNNAELYESKPTFTDILIWMVSRVLVEHPIVNSKWNDGKIIQYSHVNMGIATNTQEGLIVPVIHEADIKGFSQIVAERSRLVEAARNNKLEINDITGGTFTLSNLGMFGIDIFQGILNIPEAALLTVGSVNNVLEKEKGEIVEKPVMKVSLSCDHRVLDGATGAGFLKRLKDVVEDPKKMLDTDLFA